MYALHKPRPRPARLRFRFTRWPSRAPTTTHTHTHRAVCGRALNVADPSGFVFATVLHVHEPCVYKRVYTRTTPPILLLLSSLCSSRRNVSIAALDLWVTVPSPIDTHNAALPYVGVRRAPERKSLCRQLAKSSKRFERSYLDQSGQLTWYFHRERSCRFTRPDTLNARPFPARFSSAISPSPTPSIFEKCPRHFLQIFFFYYNI